MLGALPPNPPFSPCTKVNKVGTQVDFGWLPTLITVLEKLIMGLT